MSGNEPAADPQLTVLRGLAGDVLDVLDQVDDAIALVESEPDRRRFTSVARLARHAVDLLVEDVELAAAGL
jgi:hypothetical protein